MNDITEHSCLGHRVGILAVHRMAVGIDADLAARELHGAAHPALAADQTVDHVALAPGPDRAVFLSNSARMPLSIGSMSLKARNFM